jgi:hypothetical protein
MRIDTPRKIDIDTVTFSKDNFICSYLSERDEPFSATVNMQRYVITENEGLKKITENEIKQNSISIPTFTDI